jgi:hypothetical protein
MAMILLIQHPTPVLVDVRSHYVVTGKLITAWMLCYHIAIFNDSVQEWSVENVDL